MKTISVSREFGGGKRELGKRLADELEKFIERLLKRKTVPQQWCKKL